MQRGWNKSRGSCSWRRREPATIKQKSRPAAAEIKLERGCNQLVFFSQQNLPKRYPATTVQINSVGQQFLCWRLGAGVFTATEVSPTTQRQNDRNPMPLRASSKLQFTCQPGKFYWILLFAFGYLWIHMWHLHRLEFGAQRPSCHQSAPSCRDMQSSGSDLGTASCSWDHLDPFGTHGLETSWN